MQITFLIYSCAVAQIVVDMDQEGPEIPLQGKQAYFDGSHSQCIDYKTLALFVYHTVMWCILKIATVEVKSESV